MSSILLASSNFQLNTQALKYAWELSEELNSKFSILEIMSKENANKHFRALKNGLKKIRWFLEDSMVDITYAETLTLSEYKKKIKKELEIINQNKPLNISKTPNIYIKQGSIIEEIKNFIIENKNITMTILPIKSLGLNSKQIFSLKKEVNTPIVMIK